MKLIKFFMIVVLLISITGIVFSQAKKDTCTYQAPLISCEQAQENANAIYKYPVALQSLREKEERIKGAERELYFVRSGFEEERKVFEIDLGIQTKKAEREERRKRNWRLVALSAIISTVISIFTK